MFQFEGMVAPVFTPLRDDGSLKLDIIPKYAEHLHRNGVRGVFVGGSTGEGLSLSVSERKQLTEAWVNASRAYGLIVIVMVGAAGLTDTKDLASHADKVKASAIATLPPLYDKPNSVADLVDYCEQVSSSAPTMPLLYYHIPFKTAVELPMDEFLKEGTARIPTLSGLKFTSRDITGEGKRCLNLQSKRVTVFSGFDEELFDALSEGYKCAICCCFNFVGDVANEIFICMDEREKTLNNELKEKLQHKGKKNQLRINETLNAIFSIRGGFNISSVKAAMTIMTDIDVGPPRAHLKPLSKDELKLLQTKLSPFKHQQ